MPRPSRRAAHGDPLTAPTARARDRRVTLAVGLLALAAATWAMVGARWLEPHYSANADEHAYVHQARLLSEGRLVVAAPRGPAARSFQPWFTVETPHGAVYKYNLVWPAVLAVGELVGFLELGLGLAAAAFVVGVFFLARQLLDSPVKALVATALTTFAPVTVLQFSSYLSYIAFGALWTFAAGLLLRGVQIRRVGPVAGSGVLTGIAFAARPYDAVLVLAPFAVWAVWTSRRDRRFLVRGFGGAAVAALPVVLLQLLYNHHVTGSFTTFPFSEWAPRDTLGFGQRGLDPSGHVDVYFTVARGIEGSVAHLVAFWRWSSGGIVLAAVALVGLLTLRRQTRAWAALGLVVLLPLGYVGFWGGYQIARLGEFFTRLGPYYFLPILVPVGIFAAEGLWTLWAQRRRLTIGALTAMVGVAGFGTTRAVGVALDERAARAQPYDLLARHFDQPHPRALVFLPESYLGLTLPDLGNRSMAASEPVLYAAAGHDTDLAAVERFPRRTPYRLLGCDFSYRGPLGTERLPFGTDRLFPLVTGAGSRLQHLDVTTTTELRYRLTLRTATARAATVTIDAGAHAARAVVVAPPSGRAVIDITIRADAITLTGSVGPVEAVATPPGTRRTLAIGVTHRRAGGRVPTAADPDYGWDAALRVDGPRLTTLGPPTFTTTETDLGIPFRVEQCHARAGIRLVSR